MCCLIMCYSLLEVRGSCPPASRSRNKIVQKKWWPHQKSKCIQEKVMLMLTPEMTVILIKGEGDHDVKSCTLWRCTAPGTIPQTLLSRLAAIWGQTCIRSQICLSTLSSSQWQTPSRGPMFQSYQQHVYCWRLALSMISDLSTMKPWSRVGS